MVRRVSRDKADRPNQSRHRENTDNKRWIKKKRENTFSRTSSASSSSSSAPSSVRELESFFNGKNRVDSKLASVKRENESRGTRTRRRPNGGSLSSRGSATTGVQCGLCAVLAGLFRRAMCIAGSRRGSGESCYQELATDMQRDKLEQRTQIQQIGRIRVSGENLGTTGSTIAGLTSVKSSESLGSVRRLGDAIQREKTVEEITVDRTGQNAVFVRISEDASLAASGEFPSATTSSGRRAENEFTTESPRILSANDRILIDNLDIGRSRIRHTGRFLTMHKRRRKRLTTRTLTQEPGLLDDILHGQVQCVLQRAGNWRFNAFTLETVTGGRSLPVLCVHLFQCYGLFQRFKLDVVRVWKLFALIEEGYHSTNPYHNSIHATDVTQAMHCFLQEEKIKRHLSSLEIMASLIAAVTHDLDHPGVNQPFLVATSNHLATLYENTSVLENHHWRSAIGCLLESGVSEQLSADVRPELQRHISSLILATDITRQQEFITKFKTYIDNNALDMERPENRHFVLQISLKCADISNPCRPWDISRKWSYKVCEEFFRQGDYERRLNLPVTPLCDRQSISIPKIQTGFFEFVVTPLYDEWNRFLGDGLSVSLMMHLRDNYKRWESLMVQEAAEETKTEMSDLEEMENSSSSGDERRTTAIGEECESLKISLLDNVDVETRDRRPIVTGRSIIGRVDRRHSVPLSVTKPPLLVIRTSKTRRDSLPGERVNSIKNHGSFRLDDRPMEDALERLSSISLLSSRSSIYESAGNASLSCERPVSAENLLPETSIASITSSVEATRLSTVLQPEIQKSSQSKHLTRQQTFPPLQPYARTRYMSTTTEMSRCRTEILMEADDNSVTTTEPSSNETKSDPAGGRCSACSDADCDSWKYGRNVCGISGRSRERGDRRGSKLRDCDRDDGIGRRSSNAVIETVATGVDLSRRHSAQTFVTEDTNFLGPKQRHARPSSAQESHTTQIFYSSLVGGPRNSGRSTATEIPGGVSRPDSRTDSDVTSDTTGEYASTRMIPLTDHESVTSVGNSNPTSSDVFSALSEDQDRNRDTELRRYSTPMGDGRPALGENGGRRFTAIPVTSELLSSQKNHHPSIVIPSLFFIGSPPASPPRLSSVSSSSDGSADNRTNIGDFGCESVAVGSKRDSDGSRQKGFKIPKLCDDAGMKENVDPRTIDESGKSGITAARRTTQGWARRRGSAPVGLLSKLDDCPIAAVTPRIDRHGIRRGSVPGDIYGNQGGSFRSALGPRGENVPLPPRRASLPQEAALTNILGNTFSSGADRENVPSNNINNNNNNSNNNNNNNNSSSGGTHAGSNNNGSSRMTEGLVISGGTPSPRRGSVPADISELRRDLFGRNSINGKARNRKKTLRRRSSGGPEMFAGGNADDNENGKFLGSKRELKRDSVPETSVKRRGSLPVDMVPIFHSGSAAGARRASLWRL